MKAEELDRPENRRKIAQQAAAESANADRLDRLNNAGRKMIEQAARNDSFEAQKLEQWASMVKALKDIAGKKMPSVADLLKKSAGAEAAKSSPSSPSSPSEKQDQQVPTPRRASRSPTRRRSRTARRIKRPASRSHIETERADQAASSERGGP